MTQLIHSLTYQILSLLCLRQVTDPGEGTVEKDLTPALGNSMTWERLQKEKEQQQMLTQHQPHARQRSAMITL